MNPKETLQEVAAQSAGSLLSDCIISLLAENEELAKKAARYDYLCAPMDKTSEWREDIPYVTCRPLADFYAPTPIFGSDVDEAVDAAMAKQGEK